MEHAEVNFEPASIVPSSQAMELLDEQIQELLEDLDDAIFAAINGCTNAMNQARSLWTRAVAELGWQQVEESREQYLRHAINVTRRFEQDTIRSPEQAIAALEVIELLTKS